MAEFIFEGSAISVEGRETALDALLRAGHEIKHKCKSGICQQCTLRAISGDASDGQRNLDESLVELGYFLSCQTPASSLAEVAQPSEADFPRFPASVVDHRLLSADVLLLTLHAPAFPGGAGRFIRLTHRTGVTRQYSIATPSWEPSEVINMHIRLIPGGEMSELLKATTPGDTFTVEGPLGKCCYRSKTGAEPMLLIGSGTGLAPLYAIITKALDEGHRGPISLYHGAQTSERLYFTEELESLSSKLTALTIHQCVEEPENPIHRIGSPLEAALDDHADLTGYKVYLCGHPELVKNAQKKTFLAGASIADIAADSFVAS